MWADVPHTDELLSHEQSHYDVGIVRGGALARELTQLRAPSLAALRGAINDAFNLHLRRAGLIQRCYDKETHHRTVARFQRIGKNAMTGCLAHPRADHLLEWWL